LTLQRNQVTKGSILGAGWRSRSAYSRHAASHREPYSGLTFSIDPMAAMNNRCHWAIDFDMFRELLRLAVSRNVHP
jgi:hypothetical protein